MKGLHMHHSPRLQALAMVLKFETATGRDAVLSMASRRQRPVAMNDNQRSFAGLREQVTGADLRRLPDLFAILDNRRNRPGRLAGVVGATPAPRHAKSRHAYRE